MKKFTKCLLTLALVCMACVANAKETVIGSIDYSDPEASMGWFQTPEGATVEIADGNLVITNPSSEGDNWSLQGHILGGLTLESGFDYKVNITYKLVTEQENPTVTVALWADWSTSTPKYGTPISASDDFQVLPLEFKSCGFSTTGGAIMWQSRAVVGTIYISKVEVIEIRPDDYVEPTWKAIYENDGTDLTTVITKYFKNYEESVTEEGAIVVESLDPDNTYDEYNNAGNTPKLANDWDTQFMIGLPYALPKGIKLKISMNMKADKVATCQWQSHTYFTKFNDVDNTSFDFYFGKIENVDCGGTYQGSLGVSDYTFTTDWLAEPFEATISVPSDNMSIICLNLEVLREVNKYYFKDIEVSVTEEDYENYLADPLKAEKAALEAAITIGKAQNGFGKTEESFSKLTSALATAEGLDVESADKEKLVDAANAINEAIAGFKPDEGYSKLTKEMFRNWDSATEPTTDKGAAGCAYDLNKESGMPYGDGSVGLLNFADLSEFNKFVIIANGGTPRILLNRDIDEGQWNADEAESHLIDNTKGDESSWHMKYYAREDKTTTVDLETLAKEKGFAHLHSIKTVGGNVTTTDMLLYRFVSFGDAHWASFGSQFKNTLFNSDVTAYAVKFNSETGKMDLTKVEDGIVPARVGVILESEKPETLPEFDVEAADAVESDLLISNGTVKGDGESIYVLAKKGEVVGFYLLTKDEVIPAGKAYYKAPAGDGARAFIALGGDVTGIKTVESVKAANNAIYNLAGQRLVKAQKGLNIVNGKKIMK